MIGAMRALVLLLVSTTTSAATYSVGATRTYTSVCTLAAAVPLQPGDVVEIDPGTYTDASQLTASGTAQAPITLRGVPGMARPVFDATGLDLSRADSVPRAIFQFCDDPMLPTWGQCEYQRRGLREDRGLFGFESLSILRRTSFAS